MKINENQLRGIVRRLVKESRWIGPPDSYYDPPDYDDPSCEACGDEGSIKCEKCGGEGGIYPPGEDETTDPNGETTLTCPDCDGYGEIECTECPTCPGCGGKASEGDHSRCYLIDD